MTEQVLPSCQYGHQFSNIEKSPSENTDDINNVDCTGCKLNSKGLLIRRHLCTKYLTLQYGGLLSYDDTGEPVGLHSLCKMRPVILCISAPGDNRYSFRHFVPWLYEAKYRIVTMDLRGTGESSPIVASHYSSVDIVQDILRLVKELKLTFNRKIVIVAHAESCVVAIQLASNHHLHWLQGLMLITPNFNIHDVSPEGCDLTTFNKYLNLIQVANINTNKKCWDQVKNFWHHFHRKKRALEFKRQRYGINSAPKDMECYLSIIREQWSHQDRFNTSYKMMKKMRSKKEAQRIQVALKEIHCPVILVCGSFDQSLHDVANNYLGNIKKFLTNVPLCQVEVLFHCGGVPQEEQPVYLMAILDNLCESSFVSKEDDDSYNE